MVVFCLFMAKRKPHRKAKILPTCIPKKVRDQQYEINRTADAIMQLTQASRSMLLAIIISSSLTHALSILHPPDITRTEFNTAYIRIGPTTFDIRANLSVIPDFSCHEREDKQELVRGKIILYDPTATAGGCSYEANLRLAERWGGRALIAAQYVC